MFLPFGNIECSKKELIEKELSIIEDDKVFILLRDIICCAYNYYNIKDNKINEFMKIFPIKKDLSIIDIIDFLVEDIDKWIPAFEDNCDYKSLFTSSKYDKKEKVISKCPYTNTFTWNVLLAMPYSEDGGLSPEVIMYLDQLKHINHSVYFDGGDARLKVIKSIFRDGFLKPGKRQEQYPGVYTTLFKSDEFATRNYPDFIHIIFPLYLLKSNAWFANIHEAYGTVFDATITSESAIDYISADTQTNPNFEEIIFQYNLPIKNAIHVVCDDKYYKLLKPIVGEKLIKRSKFQPRRFIDDLFEVNDYNRRRLRLDYTANDDYGALLSTQSLHNILLNSSHTEEEAKRIVRTTERKKLIKLMHDSFWEDYHNGIVHKVKVHPPW